MACKYKNKVWDNGWCNVAFMYCTATQEATCRHNHQTNGDRFRSMSDEDIAVWCRAQIGCGFDYFPCGIVCNGECETYTTEDCQAKIIDWLQKSVEEERWQLKNG